MSQVEVIIRYNLVIKKLRRGPATWKSINDYLTLESDLQGYNLCRDKRTFARDIKDILSIYQIEINWDHSKEVYFINDAGESAVNERRLEAFDTLYALNIYEDSSKYLHLEKRRPLGTENLFGLLHAVKNQLQVTFSYQKYYSAAISERSTSPLALKEFKNRWYLIVRDLEDDLKIKSFALDRLTNLVISKKKAATSLPFDIEKHYQYCFGIMSPNDAAPAEIILSFNKFQGNYIKSLPLHESQEILVDNEDWLHIKLTLYITTDLVMELLSYGENMVVLEPAVLVNQIRTAHQQAAIKQDF